MRPTAFIMKHFNVLAMTRGWIPIPEPLSTAFGAPTLENSPVQVAKRFRGSRQTDKESLLVLQ